MGMATLQFYRNQYYYPHYSETIHSYGSPMDCTPVGINLRSGTLRVKGDMTDFMSCNYLAFTRDYQTLYAWIDDVKFRTEDSFEVTYTVDPWRTFKNRILLGTQFIARQPEPTNKLDNLLGTDDQQAEVIYKNHEIGRADKRIFIVQVRTSTGEIFSSAPVQPNPYQLFMIEYDTNNWTATQPLDNLIRRINSDAKPENIVTMYSVPWFNISTLGGGTGLPIQIGGNTDYIDGFTFLGNQDISSLIVNETPLSFGTDIVNLIREPHTVQVVIPEAGIINITDDLLLKDNLRLRQDIDLYSGAVNYMLVGGNSDDEFYNQSVRGSSISSIPIVSDPLDTYLSQNQNALTTSLIGDVASIVGGVGTAISTGGIGAGIGAGMASSGVSNIVGRMAGQADMANQYSNPPAFLGTAMAANFNGQFWTLVTRLNPDNASLVHSAYGYPLNKIDVLQFPEAGYIKTEGCAVTTVDGNVPRWAISEINDIFNSGIQVH